MTGQTISWHVTVNHPAAVFVLRGTAVITEANGEWVVGDGTLAGVGPTHAAALGDLIHQRMLDPDTAQTVVMKHMDQADPRRAAA